MNEIFQGKLKPKARNFLQNQSKEEKEKFHKSVFFAYCLRFEMTFNVKLFFQHSINKNFGIKAQKCLINLI